MKYFIIIIIKSEIGRDSNFARLVDPLQHRGFLVVIKTQTRTKVLCLEHWPVGQRWGQGRMPGFRTAGSGRIKTMKI